jgi:outer membrane protein assembly factor BamD
VSVYRHGLPAAMLVLLAAGLILGGCSSSEQATTLSAEERFEKGRLLYGEEDYLEAINEFTVVTLQYQGSAVADDAQCYLGECRFQREEYLLAAFEYQQLIRNMPASPLTPDAQYKIGLCYYNLSPKSSLDQVYTLKAIDELQTFVEYHPAHAQAVEAERLIKELTRRLAKKSFEVAEQYGVLEYYRAAVFYYDDVIEKYHDTEYAPQAYVGKTRMQLARRKYTEALQTITGFLEKFPESELRGEALQLKARAEEGRTQMAPLSGQPGGGVSTQ